MNKGQEKIFRPPPFSILILMILLLADFKCSQQGWGSPPPSSVVRDVLGGGGCQYTPVFPGFLAFVKYTSSHCQNIFILEVSLGH